MSTMLLFAMTLTAPVPYWKDPRIHSMGNGILHASVARLATALIDRVSYGGRNIRADLLTEYATGAVVDLCCGTGTSTPYGAVGVDTSAAMIREARWRRGPTHDLRVDNAETFGDDDSFDVATIFFALHEMPAHGRMRVLKNAMRIARKRVLICDISPRKVPSNAMLAGEPYLLDYQAHITDELSLAAQKGNLSVHEYIPNHVLVGVIELC